MKDKFVGFIKNTAGKIVGVAHNNKGKLMSAGAFVLAQSTTFATDYDPGTIVTGLGTLFQTAIAVAAVIITTLMGIRVVKKAMRAA